MRASDADREHVAERLREATAEGRLLADELEQRLGTAFSARTYGELDELVSDLPGTVPQRGSRSRSLPRVRPAAALALLVAIPIIFALVLAVVVVVASLFAAWALLLALGWWLLGHRRGLHRGRYVRSIHACGRWHDGRAGARPGSWM
jgi:Flp pilus assembly protein TadB